MSGGDGKGHNSGAHDSGGSINGTSGKGGPSSGGASDNSGWSSENNPWGGGNSGMIGGSQGGNGANHGGENTSSNYGKDVSRQIGDAIARKEGINPKIFTGYFIRSDGYLIGITPLVSGDAFGVNLGLFNNNQNSSSENKGWNGRNGDGIKNSSQGGWKIKTNELTSNQVAAAKSVPEPKNSKYYKSMREASDEVINSNLNQGHGVGEAARAERDYREKVKNAINDNSPNVLQDAIKFTADFYKEVFNAYGEKAEKLAKLLADQAKGKKIRNVEDALKSYEKHKANINKKINAKDREAIAKALESMDVGKAAKNIAKFSKGLGWVGPAIDITDWFTELYKAVKTDNWRSLYVKTETIAVGLAATHVTALAFSAVLGGPIGILGYGLIMAGVGALVNETIVDEANKVIGI